MATTYPGTTIEVTTLRNNSSRILFSGIFAGGRITMSQISNMTGLEPYMVQNWVKRKYVTPPKDKLYSKEQFARILIINMLRDSLQIEAITNLIYAISGEYGDASDDLISDDELYHIYVNMLSDKDIDLTDSGSVEKAAQRASRDFEGKLPGAKKKLMRILEVMYYAHSASRLCDLAKEMLSSLK